MTQVFHIIIFIIWQSLEMVYIFLLISPFFIFWIYFTSWINKFAHFFNLCVLKFYFDISV